MTPKTRGAKYPKLTTPLPPYLHARLHAVATVLQIPVETLVEQVLQRHVETLDETKRELIDRVAASLLERSEIDGR